MWRETRSLGGVGLLIAAVCLALSGCSALSGGGRGAASQPLRVGISPDYPPLIYKQGDRVSGVEAEMARSLGARLGRPVQFVEVRWEIQIDALLEGKTDIIMSGMSITRAREIRVRFCDPYLENGLMTAVRRDEAADYATEEDIRRTTKTIGVPSGTTADAWVRENCPGARRMAVADPSYAAYELSRRRLDLFIHDAHAIAWLVSQNEADLAGIWIPLSREQIAWAVRRDDADLLRAANQALIDMQRDGTLAAIVDKWLPYAKLRSTE